MISAVSVVHAMAAAALLAAIAAVAAGHISTLVRLQCLQSLALGVLAAAVAYRTGEAHIYAVAALVIGIKAIATPWMLSWVMVKIKVDREVEPVIPVPASLLICGALTVVAFHVTQPMMLSGGAMETITKDCLSISLAVALIGFFTMISRKKAMSQVLGLLTMENGLFLAAISVTYGMPLIVEIGVFFDVLVAVLIMGLLAFRINKTFETIDTTILRRLRD